MHRRKNVRSEIALNRLPTISCHAEILSQQGLRCARTKADQNLRLNHLKLRVEPRPAGFNFRLPRFFVNPTFATLCRFPLEVLHDVGDIDRGAIDSHLGQHLIEQSPGRSDKRMRGTVFAIAWLFSHKHDARGCGAFSKNGLRSGQRHLIETPGGAGPCADCWPSHAA